MQWTPRICTKCEPNHADNCPKCFGFGVKVNGTPIPAGDVDCLTDTGWKRCAVCGGTPHGIEKAEEAK